MASREQVAKTSLIIDLSLPPRPPRYQATMAYSNRGHLYPLRSLYTRGAAAKGYSV